jgi:hypothetical protein
MAKQTRHVLQQAAMLSLRDTTGTFWLRKLDTEFSLELLNGMEDIKNGVF